MVSILESQVDSQPGGVLGQLEQAASGGSHVSFCTVGPCRPQRIRSLNVLRLSAPALGVQVDDRLLQLLVHVHLAEVDDYYLGAQSAGQVDASACDAHGFLPVVFLCRRDQPVASLQLVDRRIRGARLMDTGNAKAIEVHAFEHGRGHAMVEFDTVEPQVARGRQET